MTQISSMTGQISSLRAQLRAQADAALAPETTNTGFTDRMGNALKEVANAQNDAASTAYIGDNALILCWYMVSIEL